MYQHILIALEHSAADETILDHIKPLAKLTGARLLLLHVADGWVARNYDRLELAESDEMREDRAYLAGRAAELRAEGFTVDYLLALGEPADEVVKVAAERGVDLVAMSTHGHRFISDLLHGSTADKVRHQVDVPVLLLKARL
ncbi:MAG TPA: universal stress protein [Chthoniobacteraceae bacterium]|nr:universal stress protein [Chthoniobacteraceae bacterium]